MASAWGGSWGRSWLNSWGPISQPAPVVYMRPPAIPEDADQTLSFEQMVMLAVGAELSGLTSGPLVDSTN